MSEIYSIDTSSLIHAGRLYPFDLFPTLWDNISSLIQNTTLYASEEVIVELSKKDDDLFKWVKSMKNMSYPSIESVQGEVRKIVNEFTEFVDVENEKSRADPYVIAIAKVTGGVVITQERLKNNLDYPNIPDICKYYSIKYLSILDFLRAQNWKY